VVGEGGLHCEASKEYRLAGCSTPGAPESVTEPDDNSRAVAPEPDPQDDGHLSVKIAWKKNHVRFEFSGGTSRKIRDRDTRES
jgi:hypothetical protein